MGAICELPLELLIYELNLAIVSEKPQKGPDGYFLWAITQCQIGTLYNSDLSLVPFLSFRGHN